MAFRPRELSVLAYANGFTLWHYASADPVARETPPPGGTEAVLAPGYFDPAADMLRAGDLVLVTSPPGEAPASATILVVARSGARGVAVAELAPSAPGGSQHGAGIAVPAATVP